MKKLCLLFFIALFTMCHTTKKTISTSPDSKEASLLYTEQYRDDFKKVSDTQKSNFLKKINATAANYSVIIFTNKYQGEEFSVSNEKGSLFNNQLISNMSSGVANKVRIENTLDTKIIDRYKKQEFIIEAEKAKEYKFIYIMKDYTNSASPYKITYSNSLRPLI